MDEIVYDGAGVYGISTKDATYKVVLPDITGMSYKIHTPVYNFSKGKKRILAFMEVVSDPSPDPSLAGLAAPIRLESFSFSLAEDVTDVSGCDPLTTGDDIEMIIRHDDTKDIAQAIKDLFGKDLLVDDDTLKGGSPKKNGFGTLRPIP